MTEINYKPLSANMAWQGRRFKTKEYQKFERDMLLLLPKIKMPAAPYALYLEFGMSKSSDVDNPLKMTIDVLQKKYGINDKDIITLIARKKIVKKGKEFIKFEIISNEAAH